MLTPSIVKTGYSKNLVNRPIAMTVRIPMGLNVSKPDEFVLAPCHLIQKSLHFAEEIGGAKPSSTLNASPENP